MLGNEVDYTCCRRLAEYIPRNIDTSPGYAQQMDCSILAYQSNASIDILNSVVTKDLWFRRKNVDDKEDVGDGQGEKKKAINKHTPAAEMKATGLKVVSKKSVVNLGAASLLNGKVENKTKTGIKQHSQERQHGVTKVLVAAPPSHERLILRAEMLLIS